MLSLCLVLALVGCGASVASEGGGDTGGDGGGDTSGVADAGSAVAPGCPPKNPPAGQPCINGPYYCQYYVAGVECAKSNKCSSKGGPPYAFFGTSGEPNCYPTLRRELCVEDAACNGIEENGGCVVECERSCRCIGTTGRLSCTKLSC